MALTGIQIFKLLPKTNCKECGVPTCLAFAMNLASGKAELDSCPYVSDEAREQLAEASAPPIRPVVIGKGVRKLTVGGETVQYRHEKTFYNPTGLAACVGSDIPPADLEKKLAVWNAFQFERVGLNLRPELVALKDVGGDAAAFAEKAKTIAESSEFNLILMTEDPEVMKAGVEACKFKRPLMYAATADNVDAFGSSGKGKRPAACRQGRFRGSPGAPDGEVDRNGIERTRDRSGFQRNQSNPFPTRWRCVEPR